jgi:hypothetical protein
VTRSDVNNYIIMWLFKCVLLGLFVTFSRGSQDGSEHALDRGVAQQYLFSGEPRWQLRELLTSRTVSINCTEEVQIQTSIGMNVCAFTMTYHNWSHASLLAVSGVLRAFTTRN